MLPAVVPALFYRLDGPIRRKALDIASPIDFIAQASERLVYVAASLRDAEFQCPVIKFNRGLTLGG